MTNDENQCRMNDECRSSNDQQPSSFVICFSTFFLAFEIRHSAKFDLWLNAPALGWPAAVVRNGGDVLDCLDDHAGGLQSGNCAFAAGARTAHADFQLFDAILGRLLRRLLSSHLAGEGRALAAAFEAAGAGAGPAEGVALGVCDSHNRVIER